MAMMFKWGQFSTMYSRAGFIEARERGLTLEEAGSLIHDYWVAAQTVAEKQLEWDKPFLIDYTAEKAESHQAMRVSYAELSREDQIKDLYLIYEFDEDWFMKQEGAEEIKARFPEIISWVDWTGKEGQ
ncbi:MAG: hypothetical protein VW551_06075 [Euryarchaeota archaeon]|jgi:hypothetical protein